MTPHDHFEVLLKAIWDCKESTRARAEEVLDTFAASATVIKERNYIDMFKKLLEQGIRDPKMSVTSCGLFRRSLRDLDAVTDLIEGIATYHELKRVNPDIAAQFQTLQISTLQLVGSDKVPVLMAPLLAAMAIRFPYPDDPFFQEEA